MSSSHVTRSSVLGKRGHQQDDGPKAKDARQLASPEATPSPKRARTTTVIIQDGQANKENIPPFKLEAVNADAPATPRATRTLRRTATEAAVPRGQRQTPRRRASASSLPSTPAQEAVDLAIATPPPTPPTVLLPLHARVKALLRATSNDADLTVAGRESERDTIAKFLFSLLSIDNTVAVDDTPTVLFISGSPGSGKTALVNSINQGLTKQHSDLSVVFVNCMTVKTLDALWDRLIEELRGLSGTPGRSKKEKGLSGVLSLLKSPKKKLIIVLDELDHVAADPQSLSALFSLADKSSSTLRVIGIANTHTLTANASSDAPNVMTLHFAPYTPTQLQAILRARLASLYHDPLTGDNIKKMLPNPAIVLLTKRIANITGDVRSLFEVLRGSIDLAVAAKNGASTDVLDAAIPTVSPPHVLAALKAHAPATSSKPSNATSVPATTSSNSEAVNKIRNLSFQSRVVLLSLLIASKRLAAGLRLTSNLLSSPVKKTAASPVKRTNTIASPTAAAGIDTQQLYTFYANVLERSDVSAFDPVSRTEFGDLLNVLEGVGLLQMSSSLGSNPSPKKRAFGRQSSFGAGLGRNGAGTVGEVKLVDGVWADEILRGLGISDTPIDESDVRNEEVKALWIAENTKITRDVKLLATTMANNEKNRVLGFADASED